MFVGPGCKQQLDSRDWKCAPDIVFELLQYIQSGRAIPIEEPINQNQLILVIFGELNRFSLGMSPINRSAELVFDQCFDA